MGELFLHDLKSYIDTYGCEAFVETGTGVGTGIDYALHFDFKRLYSIEIMEDLYVACKESLNDPRLTLLNTDSYSGLTQIVNELADVSSTLFWLDAHFPGADFGYNTYDHGSDSPETHMPLQIELELIHSFRSKCNDVFIIDDWQLYEDVIVELPNKEIVEKFGRRKTPFVEKLYGETHDFFRDSRHQGFLILTPKKE